MLITAPTVIVAPKEAALLLRLCAPEITSWQTRGQPISDDLKRLLGELATAANAVTNDTRSDPVPTPHTDPFRGPIIEGVPTSEAAHRLGITQRAVIARLHRRTLPGVQLPDGTWLVDIAHHGAPRGRVGDVAAASPCGTPARPTVGSA